jgi:AcrR family transcriptional regulator
VTSRDDQREATRRRIVDVAVESLIDCGFAATTTVEVQRRAGLSRGALLHHFPTREDLFTAAVHRLVETNLEAMWDELAKAPADSDPIARGIWVLRRASRRKSFGAELELWGAARSDTQLRTALHAAERAARQELYAVMDAVFGPDVVAAPSYPMVVDLTVQLIRGLTISAALRSEVGQHEPVVDQWVRVVRSILAGNVVEQPTQSAAAVDVP